MQKIVAKLQIF